MSCEKELPDCEYIKDQNDKYLNPHYGVYLNHKSLKTDDVDDQNE